MLGQALLRVLPSSALEPPRRSPVCGEREVLAAQINPVKGFGVCLATGTFMIRP